MSVLDTFDHISADIGQLGTTITPLLVGAGVISPVAQVTPSGTSYSTSISSQNNPPGTLFGFSTSTILLVVGGILAVLFLILLLA